jgi:predicted Fe-Mo cluster-binding NifX family protein
MRIAVTYDKGEVFPHFGRTPAFKIYDIDESGKIVSSAVVETGEISHGALAGMLNGLHTDVVICGGLGIPMLNKLSAFGMKVYGGVDQKADEAVRDYLGGNLQYDPQAAEKHGGCAHSDSPSMMS